MNMVEIECFSVNEMWFYINYLIDKEDPMYISYFTTSNIAYLYLSVISRKLQCIIRLIALIRKCKYSCDYERESILETLKLFKEQLEKQGYTKIILDI